MGVWKMPSLPWWAFWHLLSPALPTVPAHHSGVSHLSAFHGTHWPKSKIAGSGGIFLPSSSKVSSYPRRKEATISFSSGSSSKSEPPPLDPSSPDCVLGSADWLETGWSSNQTVWHLFFPPSWLGHQWSLLLGQPLDCKWAWVWFSLSISLLRVDMAANAFWCASHTMAKLLSTESSFLIQ